MRFHKTSPSQRISRPYGNLRDEHRICRILFLVSRFRSSDGGVPIWIKSDSCFIAFRIAGHGTIAFASNPWGIVTSNAVSAVYWDFLPPPYPKNGARESNISKVVATRFHIVGRQVYSPHRGYANTVCGL